MQQRTTKPVSRNISPTADELRMALEGSALEGSRETSEGIGATNQISDPHTRRGSYSDS